MWLKAKLLYIKSAHTIFIYSLKFRMLFKSCMLNGKLYYKRRMARKITNGLHYFTLGFHFNHIRIHYIMPIVGNTLIVIINKTTSGKGYYSEAK